MKRIIVTMDDDVYKALKSHMSVRGLAQAAYGISDGFMVKLVEAMEQGLEEKHFSFVKPTEDETK